VNHRSVVVRAAERAARLTERLAEPVEHCGEWAAASLNEGHAGVALVHGATDRRTAHAHLSSALRGYRGSVRSALFHGGAAIGFAARVAAGSGPGYRSLLSTVDARVAGAAGRLADDLLDRLRAGERPEPGHYDTVLGLAGLGRYLLAAGVEHRPALDRVLAALVVLAEAGGVADLGLAHGLAGPLALLAIARMHGVRVAGQDEAIGLFAEELAARVIVDDVGSFWPNTTEHDKTRAGWCYGTPGVAHTLHLAALAMAEPAWARLAVDTLRSVLDGPHERWRITDAALCHGASGLLHVTGRLAEHHGEFAGYLPGLAEFVLDHPDPEPVGLLDGAAGLALVLREFADGRTDESSALRWDAALLLC
jgi:hypothetical protein